MGMTAQQMSVQLHTAPELEQKLNMPGFILWARENLIPNGIAKQLNFSTGGYRELKNVVFITHEYGLAVDRLLTEWAKEEYTNPLKARTAQKVASALYEYGRGDTSAANFLGMHRSTVQNYRVSAMNYLWRRRGGLGLDCGQEG